MNITRAEAGSQMPPLYEHYAYSDGGNVLAARIRIAHMTHLGLPKSHLPPSFTNADRTYFRQDMTRIDKANYAHATTAHVIPGKESVFTGISHYPGKLGTSIYTYRAHLKAEGGHDLLLGITAKDFSTFRTVRIVSSAQQATLKDVVDVSRIHGPNSFAIVTRHYALVENILHLIGDVTREISDQPLVMVRVYDPDLETGVKHIGTTDTLKYQAPYGYQPIGFDDQPNTQLVSDGSSVIQSLPTAALAREGLKLPNAPEQVTLDDIFILSNIEQTREAKGFYSS